MKTRTLLLLILCVGLINASAEAQFLKKLKKTAENAVERTVLNKTDQGVSQKTGEVIDETVSGGGNNDSNNQGAKSDGSQSSNDQGSTSETPTQEEQDAKANKMMNMFGGGLDGVPDSYEFSYIVTYEITSDKDEINFEYYLEPNAPYFGNKTQDPRANSIIVYDLKKNFMVTFMDDGKQKMAMKMKMPNMKKIQQKYGDKLFPEEQDNETQIIPIEGKTILGYNCSGYKIINKDGEGKVWFTNDAPVSLNGVFANFKKKPETGPYANMPFNEKTLIMEMEFQSSKKKKDNMIMKCVGLDEKAISIQKKDYKTGM